MPQFYVHYVNFTTLYKVVSGKTIFDELFNSGSLGKAQFVSGFLLAQSSHPATGDINDASLVPNQIANRVALDKAHLLPRTCRHGYIRLPLAALSLDEDHQHARVLSRRALCVVFFRKHFVMHPIGDQLAPSHCGRMLDCTATLANYYSNVANLEYQSLNRIEFFNF